MTAKAPSAADVERYAQAVSAGFGHRDATEFVRLGREADRIRNYGRGPNGAIPPYTLDDFRTLTSSQATHS